MEQWEKELIAGINSMPDEPDISDKDAEWIEKNKDRKYACRGWDGQSNPIYVWRDEMDKSSWLQEHIYEDENGQIRPTVPWNQK